ncbi:hypothetical protein [Methylobacterium radiodurans]|uniref:Uncharacterized protein n=1 Tax=Methylobacterium radiodurans TaxID=2202828 RepID=A0A2U8VWV0_9HYPH|nr:hypothetical protein [Methylobacterium radiodurans]AWN37948.1 hypothetical protein DK427_21260 [Methylobacterium radiodurans]
MTATRYVVRLSTRDGWRMLTDWEEREAVPMAEAVMRRYEGETMRVVFMMASPDPDARRWIAFYLTDLALLFDLRV